METVRSDLLLEKAIGVEEWDSPRDRQEPRQLYAEADIDPDASVVVGKCGSGEGLELPVSVKLAAGRKPE
jgi:hypothetical protein